MQGRAKGPSRPLTFTSFRNWQVYPDWPLNHPDGPALETWDTFDGTGQIAKHVSHTRADWSSDSEFGINYWVADETTTTYYVHSTVLGGKTIEEINQSGTKTAGYVYSGGALVATQHINGSYNSIQMNCTNPVTGSVISADVNASYPTRQEPDPLGRYLTSPPDPGLVSSPLNNVSPQDRAMPIEYTGGPSDYYLQGNADWDAARALYTWEYQQGYWDKGGPWETYFALKNQFINAVVNKDFSAAETILANNPNFFISINGKSTAGAAGADALEGALLNLPA